MPYAIDTRRARVGVAAIVGALALAIALIVAAPARALEVKDVSATVSSHQAGGHPDSTVRFHFVTEDSETHDESGASCNSGAPTEADYCVVKGGSPRDTVVQLPKGLVGSVRGLGTCTLEQLSQPAPACPVSSQVGMVPLRLLAAGAPLQYPGASVYNMSPLPGEAARLGFRVASVSNAFVSLRVRNGGDYGLTASSENIFNGLALIGAEFTIWGNASDPSHDSQRWCPSKSNLGCSAADIGINRPFMTNPAECDVPGSVTLSARAWGAPNDWVTATSAPETMEGCDRESFDPSFTASVDSSAAGSPTGLGIHLSLPDTYDNPNGLATPPLRDATITLPSGMALNPSTAGGLGACASAQMHLDSEQHGECPQSSKLGSVKVTTPLLEDTFTGALYLGSQLSDDPRSGEMFRLMLEIENEERGVDVRVPGKVFVDPDTGQITTSFKDNPQLPFSTLDVNLKTGPRAPLTLPKSCGTYQVKADLTGWGTEDRPVTLSSPLKVTGNCQSPSFTPGFQAGTANPIGGSYAPFTMRITSPEGQQNLSRIEATLPKGVLAKLAGVPLCPEAQAGSGDCPSSSQIGTTTVAAGAGPEPIYVPEPGKPATAVYLAGPYRGAPYSLIAKVPAQAGPFDLGTVTVRNALFVDPTSAQVTAKSDPLPQILQGIPIAYRDVRVDVDRSQFTLNPTNCDPMEVTGTLGSIQGAQAKVSDRFQVASCERLAFKPDLKLSVKGPTHRSAHPRFKAVLTMPRQNGANIQKAQVTLPRTEFLENAHIRTICTRVQYAAKACPAASVYGYAKAWTPLLDQPLQGPVYLRSSSHKLPDLVASLDGQIHVDLVGRIDAVNARIRNTFETVPDAPVSRFVLEMQGGKKGLLVNNTELCKTTPRAAVKFDAQNGKVADSNPVMKAQCGKAKRKGSKHKR